MLALAPALALALACSPASTGSADSGRDDGRPWGDGGTAADGGSGDGGSGDSGTAGDGGTSDGGDDTVETIPGGDDPAVGLCHITLDCDAEIPDEGRIPCALTVIDSDGDVYWDQYAGVETRGRSSGSAPKHQYSIELWDEDGDEGDANLLGMGDESDWVLNGNYYDRALIRNPLAYDLFNAAGAVGSAKHASSPRYAAEHRYCDLVLDGSWVGIYSLMEKIKRDDDRIDIDGDDGTGSSFVVKLHDSDYLLANRLGYGGWKVVYPSDPDAGQRDGIRAWLEGWQAAALATPASLSDWVDLDSAVDVILLEELLKNTDAYYLSLHAFKDRDGVLHLVPWDLDLSLGQPNYNDNENPRSWVYYRPAVADAFGDVPGFDERLATRWAELRAGPWATDQILARIDGYQETMGEDAIAHNFEVWPIGSIAFGDYLYPVSSYAEEDARVRAWIEVRAAWMDDHVDTWSRGS